MSTSFSVSTIASMWVLGPGKGSGAVCSRYHLPAPGYDQLAERRFEFIPVREFFVFPLYATRRVDCPRCGMALSRKSHGTTANPMAFAPTGCLNLPSKLPEPESASPFLLTTRILFAAERLEWIPCGSSPCGAGAGDHPGYEQHGGGAGVCHRIAARDAV